MRLTRFEDPDPHAEDAYLQSTLSTALETDGVALNWYQIPPGEGFPSGLHAHMDQEEVFVVVAGTATFETLHLPGFGPHDEGTDPSVDTHQVSAGEAVSFEPGEFQTGWNRGAEPITAVAIGAPKETTDVRIPATCPGCSEPALRLETGEDSVQFDCPSCEETYEPAPCPACGRAELTMTLGDGGDPVARCRECDVTFDEPPFY